MEADHNQPDLPLLKFVKESLWKQFGASLDMLENAITLWPDEEWDSDSKLFYMAYHTVIFLDYYTTMPAALMSSPLPFTFTKPADIPKEALDDIIPYKIYSKQELLAYLNLCRKKCAELIKGFNSDNLADRWVEVGDDRNYAIFELILYNMRHVQHHAAQMNVMLRQKIDSAPQWISQTKSTFY